MKTSAGAIPDGPCGASSGRLTTAMAVVTSASRSPWTTSVAATRRRRTDAGGARRRDCAVIGSLVEHRRVVDIEAVAGGCVGGGEERVEVERAARLGDGVGDAELLPVGAEGELVGAGAEQRAGGVVFAEAELEWRAGSVAARPDAAGVGAGGGGFRPVGRVVEQAALVARRGVVELGRPAAGVAAADAGQGDAGARAGGVPAGEV